MKHRQVDGRCILTSGESRLLVEDRVIAASCTGFHSLHIASPPVPMKQDTSETATMTRTVGHIFVDISSVEL